MVKFKKISDEVCFLIKEPRPDLGLQKYKILLNLGNLMISVGYTRQRLSFLMSLKVRKLAFKIRTRY
jgi:hypothetical protein